ncbi:hypothetical protein GF362_04580 [Candidatus Dojkabacteria bacterium]|nr:hypothetical protein [Candidatus Dojkabacteria bacterium]
MANVHIKNLLNYNSSFRFGHIEEKVAHKRGSFFRTLESKSLIDTPLEITREANKDILSNNSIRLEVQRHSQKIELIPHKVKKDINFFSLKLKAKKNEIILGGGEQYSRLNLKGKKVPVFSEEQGIGRSNDFTSKVFKLFRSSGNNFTTYLPLPIFISSLGYCCLVDTLCYVEFQFRKEKTVINIHGEFNKIIIAKTKFPTLPKFLLKKYLKAEIDPPDWALDGCILGIQGGTKKVNKKINKLTKHDAKINAVWIQDWSGQTKAPFIQQVNWTWTPDNKLYPDIKQFINKINNKNLKVLGYINPFIKANTRIYQYAHDANYLISDHNNKTDIFCPTFFKSAMVDLTNLRAYEWFKNVIKENMIENGFSGWMADFGEHMSGNLNYYDKNISYSKIHHRYIYLWNKLNYEIAVENPELFIFQRSATINSLKYVMSLWTGDQFPDLHLHDGLPSSTLAMITSSISGISNIHVDIGGYTTLPWKTRSKILMKRWLELGVFTHTMRTHEGSFPKANVQTYDKNMIHYFTKITRIRKVITPYIKSNISKLINLPNFILDNSQNLERFKYQYLFGSDILVCPPYKKNFKYKIPDNTEWTSLWTGKTKKPGVYHSSFKTQVPVFYKKHSKYDDVFTKIIKIFKE